MLSPTHLRREGEDYEAQILSKAVKAGRRTYFFDVRATRGDDYFLTITESRKITAPDGTSSYDRRSVSERAEIGRRPGSAVRCAEAQRQLPGGGGRFPRTGCPRTCRGEGKRPAAVVWDECAPCAARHSERSGADCGKSLRDGGLSARDVPGPCRRERENVRQRLSGANACSARRAISKGAPPGSGRRFFVRESSRNYRRERENVRQSRPGRMCALCSAAFRKERRRLREIPPRRTPIRTGCPRTCRREQENVRQRRTQAGAKNGRLPKN